MRCGMTNWRLLIFCTLFMLFARRWSVFRVIGDIKQAKRKKWRSKKKKVTCVSYPSSLWGRVATPEKYIESCKLHDYKMWILVKNRQTNINDKVLIPFRTTTETHSVSFARSISRGDSTIKEVLLQKPPGLWIGFNQHPDVRVLYWIDMNDSLHSHWSQRSEKREMMQNEESQHFIRHF